MTGRRGNPLVLRKILPNPDLVIASTGADIGFYIVSLVGQVIIITHTSQPKNCGYTLQMLPVTVENSFTLPAEQ